MALAVGAETAEIIPKQVC